MVKKRIVVLGAGLAGLSAAWHLQRKGIDCQVFEREPEAGGLCRSKNINGFTFDYDGHLLHFKHRYAFGLVNNLLKGNLSKHKRQARVYSYGKYTRYPFQANLYNLPPSVAKECLLGFIKLHKNGRFKNLKNKNFQVWIKYTFGDGIAKHFMLPYNTKFWTLSLQRLTCEWLDGFIPVPSLNEVIEGAIEESQRQFGYNAHFWYPKTGGINQVVLGLASRIKNIHTNCQITNIDLIKKEIKTAWGYKEKFDYLISTIPLPELPYVIKDIPKGVGLSVKKLRWNSIFNLNLGIDRRDDSQTHWAYFPQQDISFFRVGFFHNFSSHLAPPNKSSLYVEVAYSCNKSIDKSSIVSQIKKDLKKAGLLSNQDRILSEDINDIKYGYPIYDVNYAQSRNKIIKYLASKGVLSCGRYGSWRYMSMEDVILDGRKTAKFINDGL
jgi:protoporphyrinogen oxidase